MQLESILDVDMQPAWVLIVKVLPNHYTIRLNLLTFFPEGILRCIKTALKAMRTNLRFTKTEFSPI